MPEENTTASVSEPHAPCNVADADLRGFVERIERLEEEKKAISDDIKYVMEEAKASGFDVKILRRVITLRKIARDEREAMDAVLETYMHALGEV